MSGDVTMYFGRYSITIYSSDTVGAQCHVHVVWCLKAGTFDKIFRTLFQRTFFHSRKNVIIVSFGLRHTVIYIKIPIVRKLQSLVISKILTRYRRWMEAKSVKNVFIDTDKTLGCT